jgi:1,4-dihydroxy-2-naphthoate octaprenyltransferase
VIVTSRALDAPLTLADAGRLVELRTKIVSASSVLIGFAWAAIAGDSFSPAVAALFASATFLVDAGTAGFNSYFDFVRGVDTEATDHEGYKVLVHRRVDPRIALDIAGGLFAAAAALGLVLGAIVGYEVVGVGAVCMAIAFFYSGGPRPIANTPAGEWFAGGVLGWVLIALASYVEQRSVDPRVLLLGVPSSVLIACILTVNNTCDIEGDRKAGRRTLSIVLGEPGSRTLIDAMLIATFALALALIPLHVLPSWAAAPLVAAAAVAWGISRRMRARGYCHATKGASMRDISIAFVAYTLAMVTAIGLS